MDIDLDAKSDVGHLRLESPTSDIAEKKEPQEKIGDEQVRVVPLRDLARYAGRLLRASAAEASALLVTDRGRPLVLITPVTAAGPVPRYTWGQGSPGQTSETDAPALPADLAGDERAVAEVLRALVVERFACELEERLTDRLRQGRVRVHQLG